MANETLTDVFSDIADAVRAKGVTGQMTPLQMPAKITSIPSGGETPEAEWKDVNFIDYDGKNLYSYTTAEALALTELPPAPDRTSKGLTFQEWNYTLAQVKSNAQDTGKCTAGATYTTTDGKTHIKITIQDEYYSNIPLVFSQTVSEGVEVDWGDGSSPQTYSGANTNLTITHQYAPTSYPASYDITFNVNSGTMSFPTYIMGKSGDQSGTNPVTAWTTMIKEVNIGNNVTSIGNYAFYNCSSLANVTMPDSVTSIGSYVFRYCYLTSVTIPDSVTSIGNNAFNSCRSLTRVTIPNSVTSINERVFSTIDNLTSVVIPDSVTSIGNDALSYGGITSVTIPSSLTSFGYRVFEYSYLTNITMPNSVTVIKGELFSGCTQLASVTIPGSVTSIESYAFQQCYGLVKLDCSACNQVPTLASTNAFSNTNVDLKIIVPNALYNQWKSATNWSTYADRIVMANPAMSFKATQANSTIQLTQVGNPSPVSLEYMTTGSWTPYTIGDTITLANVGDEVYIRATSGANNKFGVDASNYHQFVMTGEIEANYSINYLLNQNGSDSTLADNSYLFYKLFSGCSALTKAPELWATTIANFGYYGMFYNCSSLTEAPELPATTLGSNCYEVMFSGCSSLTTAPELPAETLAPYCYSNMFEGCTSLTGAIELPAETLANGCYTAMFFGCSNLNTITLYYTGNFADAPTDAFDGWVYGVASSGTFYYNGSDTTTGVSAIPTGWTVLQIPRPELCFTAREANSTVKMMSSSGPSVSLEYSTDGSTWSPFVVGTTTVTLANIGDKMYLRATSTNAKMASSYNSNYNYFVMTGQIAASGNINSLLNGPDPDAVTTAPQYAYPNLFQGCSALVDAIDLMLPSTTASQNSYGHGMFRNCTNLVGGPTIMATNLLTGSYTAENMFYGCSSLASVKIYATGSTWSSGNTQNWMNGVPNTGTFYYNGTYTGRGTSYIPSGWTITTFTP